MTTGYTVPRDKKPNVEIETSAAKGTAYTNATADSRLDFSGVACKRTLEANPLFNKAECEVDLCNESNAGVVVGRDRPGTKTTGYGGKGHTQCGMVDIVAGRMGSYVREVDNEGELVFANPDFKVDAARIYISQKTDIDDNFHLTKGSVGNSRGKSGIGIKADDLRLIARNGIKLITGTDARDSQGDRQTATVGIDLLAGNDSSQLQPLVKGNNLVECLADLQKEIEDLREIVYSLLKYQQSYNEALLSHKHNSPFFGIQTSPSMDIMDAGLKTLITHVANTELSIKSHEANLSMWGENYLSPAVTTYINSPFNKTN